MQKILAVDDSRLILAHLKTEIEALGDYRVSKAHDGQEALDELSKNSDIDLVFLDLNMPVMDGFEFLMKMSESTSKEVPVIVISSEPKEALQKSIGLGAKSAIKKPVQKSDLFQVLAKFGFDPKSIP